MAISRSKKETIVSDLESLLASATSVAFTSNTKLTVLEISNMRREFRPLGAQYVLAKKTLIKIAFKRALGVEIDDSLLTGQIALLISSQDAIAPVGVANRFSEELKKEKKITFTGGFFEGRVLDADQIKRLATIPSREVLLARLLGSMKSPLGGFVRLADGAQKALTEQGVATLGELATKRAASASAPVATVSAPAETEVVATATDETASTEA